MPVYVYKNLTTGDTFEVQQSITESAWTEHPETGDPVKRIVQPVGIAFKGSGFYVTDSRSKAKSPSTSSASSPAAKPSAGSTDGSKGGAQKALPASASKAKSSND